MKKKFFPQLLGRPPGRSTGGLGSSGRPVGLEKLVDSMTCKLSPTTKIDLAPLFWRVQLRSSKACPGKSKNFSENHKNFQGNPGSEPKTLVFPAQNWPVRENGRILQRTHCVGPNAMWSKKCHSQAKHSSPRLMEAHGCLQRAPSGPHRLIATRGCHM